MPCSGIVWPLLENKIRRGLKNHTFGWVRKNSSGAPKAHQGWDFYAPIGTSFYAVSGGRVELVKHKGDHGLYLCHSFDFKGRKLYAFYSHLQRVFVEQGDELTCNQLLGLTGNSGNASNLAADDLHLHFEVRTEVSPPGGLAGRVDPTEIFGHCPLTLKLAG